jgi:hypothetical protein
MDFRYRLYRFELTDGTIIAVKASCEPCAVNLARFKFKERFFKRDLGWTSLTKAQQDGDLIVE